MTAQRKDVKAILDYLLTRQIDQEQAQADIKALGLTYAANTPNPVEAFLSGRYSYSDVFQAYGV